MKNINLNVNLNTTVNANFTGVKGTTVSRKDKEKDYAQGFRKRLNSIETSSDESSAESRNHKNRQKTQVHLRNGN